MTLTMTALVGDLAAESAQLTYILAALTDEQWELPTPAVGWAIRDQVSHLAYFNDAAALAGTDPARFRREASKLMRNEHFTDEIALKYRHLSPRELMDWLDRSRGEHLRVFGGIDERGVVRHRPADGELGPRPGHPGRDRPGPLAHGAAPPCRPPGRRDQRIQFPVAGTAGAGRPGAGGADRARRVGLGVGAGRRGRPGRGIGARLLPAGDAAPAPRRHCAAGDRAGRRRLAGPG